MPDLEVKQSDDPELGFPKRRRVREKDLDGHFTQEEATDLLEEDRPAKRILDPDSSSEGGAEGLSAEEEPEPQDVQLARAIEVLKSWAYFDDLRRLREESNPEAQASQSVATSETAKH